MVAKCDKCDGNKFDVQELGDIGANIHPYLIFCTNCGHIVGSFAVNA